MLDIAVQRQVLGIGGGRELRDPAGDAEEFCRVIPFAWADLAIQHWSLSPISFERSWKFSGQSGQDQGEKEQRAKHKHTPAIDCLL